MIETDFWASIRKEMKGRWLATRIETETEIGVPDVAYSLPTGHGWIELKWLKELPKRPDTPVNIECFTALQRKWLKMRGKFADKCWLFVGVEDPKEYFLFGWRQVDDIGLWTADEWRENAVVWQCGRLNGAGLVAVL